VCYTQNLPWYINYFLSLHIYDCHKVFITGCCGVVMLSIYKTCHVILMIPNCVVLLSCCCSTCCCGVMWCDVIVLHMFVYASGSHCVKTFRMGCVLSRVSSISSLTNFFFFMLSWNRVCRVILSSSSLVIWTSSSLFINFFFYRILFFFYTMSSSSSSSCR
jgi:hypothetical protein